MTASMENVVSVTKRVKKQCTAVFLCMALMAVLFSYSVSLFPGTAL